MVLLLTFAFLSGVATIVSPCILPVLPIVLSSAVGGDRWRPCGVVVGMVASFAVTTLALTALVAALRIPPDALRWIGIAIVAAAGVSLLLPEVLARIDRIFSRVGQLGILLQGQNRRGFAGGMLLGTGLGLVWAPCAGPILAAVIALAATNRASIGAAMVVLAYALGAGVPMLGIAYGGQWGVGHLRRSSRHAGVVQRSFGVLMVITALAMATNVDRSFTVWAVSALPAGWSTPFGSAESSAPIRQALTGLQPPVAQQGGAAAGAGAPVGSGQAAAATALAPVPPLLQNSGQAAEFTGITRWFNTPRPLALSTLRGKVVLIDFWTYSCINCLRTLPHLIGWYQRYQRLGFEVVGVHTPEFAFEGVPANVSQAIRQLHIPYPVALDPHYATWNAYNNQYWPAEYLIDARGTIRYTSFGEGEYATTERAIQQLLRDTGRSVTLQPASSPDMTPNHAESPETYMGSDRISNFASPQRVKVGRVQDYTTPASLSADSWALTGRWQINPSQAMSLRPGNSLDFRVTGSKVFVVLSPRGHDDLVRVFLDGKPVKTGSTAGADVRDGVVHVSMDNLYNVVDVQGRVESHRLRLVFETSGTQVYSFTFG